MRGMSDFEYDTLTTESRDGRSCLLTHLESSRHLHLQFYFIPAVHLHQAWNLGQPNAIKDGEMMAEIWEENINMVINDLNHHNVYLVE